MPQKLLPAYYPKADFLSYPEYVKELGLLYTWAAANSTSQNICPAGWHLPDTAEYRVLMNEILLNYPLYSSNLDFYDYTGISIYEPDNVHSVRVASAMLSPAREYPLAIQPDKSSNVFNLSSNFFYPFREYFTGESKSGREGGFAGKLAGAHNLANASLSLINEVEQTEFATIAYHWTKTESVNKTHAYTFDLIL
ncbi:MAG: hypothetical protein EZS26_002599 [Candidatus Ordinivivax streblomastigis]|uniref:Uncharacterized protein n=1 Tax=Candidatus Ordinivivax streblomastigis TaxID=2540710 RepID=A0A5M8NX58_9BACT|nr:MAG: hypothetical protein EZS26_002599 [Candidatus Ordinivivax streblomastigis]